MRRRVRSKRWHATAGIVLATTVGSLSAACSLALDYSGIDDGVRDGASDDALGDGATSSDGGSDGSLGSDGAAHDSSVDGTASGDGSFDGSADAPVDAAPDGPCGNHPGPTMVSIGNGCIDSTEVTIDDYTAFLTAKGGDTSGQPAACSAWDTSLVPPNWPPSSAGDVAVAYTNWCQAYTYCSWAGKHLCGAPGGGAADPSAWNDTTKSEWYKACTHNDDGVHVYPYGNNYAPTLCNGSDEGAGAALSSRATCVGGYAGLYDMSGNLYEWEDSCDDPADGAALGPLDFCHIRGGSFSDTSGNLRCDNSELVNRSGPSVNVGFRCCSP